MLFQHHHSWWFKPHFCGKSLPCLDLPPVVPWSGVRGRPCHRLALRRPRPRRRKRRRTRASSRPGVKGQTLEAGHGEIHGDKNWIILVVYSGIVVLFLIVYVASYTPLSIICRKNQQRLAGTGNSTHCVPGGVPSPAAPPVVENSACQLESFSIQVP